MWVLTGLLPASPVRKGGVKGSYTKMAIFLTGKLRPGGRGGFTKTSCSNDIIVGRMWRKHVKNVRRDTWFEI
ncbi:MAG: hypothetical protein AMK69_25980 [Nitrospira bacterium SG8_3]|nr:MAG: hypothetical protein AMK69_25980 [Nitrospira bacterium SG8_3]